MAPIVAPAGQSALTLSAESGFTIPVEVNGRTLRLRVDPGARGIVLNPDAAAKAGLKESMLGTSIEIGRVKVSGNTDAATLRIGQWTGQRRVMWYAEKITPDADGRISIANLPYPQVTLQLRAPGPNEARIDLPTEERGSSEAAYIHRLGDEEIAVRFSPEAARSFASASAGAILADHHGGTWAGEPFPHLIGLGVSRPVRPLKFARPLSLGGLPIRDMLVRTTDYRGQYALPTDAPQDPSEIVVTGKAQKSRPVLLAAIGMDHLSSCSSISYSQSTRRLSLVCRTNG